jgi:FkbM family methyltransferase
MTAKPHAFIDELIIDVGANSGEFALTVAQRNPRVTVLAIDPIPQLCDSIRQQAVDQKLSNLWIETVAIDLTERTATFNVANHHDLGVSSLLNLNTEKISADPYWKNRADLYFDNQVTVEVKPLSMLLEPHSPKRISFIKIDAQGVDLQVLESLGAYLSITDAGMLEVPATSRHALYEGERHTLRSALEKLHNLGFEPYAIKPNDHAANEHNVFFCRPDIDPVEMEARLRLKGVHLYDGKHFWHNPGNHWLEAPKSAVQPVHQSAKNEPLRELPPNTNNLVTDAEIMRRLSLGQRVFWGGTCPPLSWFRCSNQIFDPSRNYRLSATEHQQYSIVYLNEKNLGEFKAWPLIIDEALRLLKPDGLLSLRMTNTSFLSIFELMHLINARTGMVVHHETIDEKGMVEIVIHNTSSCVRPADVDGLSFGVITNGQRDSHILDLVRSVFAMRNPRGIPIQILVCGPGSTVDFLSLNGLDVRHVPEPDDFQSLGWITRKKNLLIAAASQSISIIAHDRYLFPSAFIEQLHAYGGDFDVLVCRQTMQDGRRFPDWVALGAGWSWTHPSMLDYADWSRHLYVNGGLIIARTTVLKNVPWNELLFWNQAEDVELTRRLQAAGVVPRLAAKMEAITQTMRPGFMGGFQSTPLTFARHLNSGHAYPDAEYPIKRGGLTICARMGSEFSDHRVGCGVAVGPEWVQAQKSHRLKAGQWGEITFNLRTNSTFRRRYILELGLSQKATRIKALVNDIEPDKIRLKGKRLLIQLVPEMAVQSHVCRVHVLTSVASIDLRHITLAPRRFSTAVTWFGKAQLQIKRLVQRIKKIM